MNIKNLSVALFTFFPASAAQVQQAVQWKVSDGATKTQERPMKTLIAVTAGAMMAGHLDAATIRVPEDFPTIQAAINAASAGDEVLVSAGTYVEQVLLGGKDIRLIAPAGPASTFIDGNGAWTPLLGSGEPAGCLVQGFTIRNGYADGFWSGAGVEVSGSSLTIKDCVIRDNRAAGYGWWASAGLRSQGGAVVVERCRFTNNNIAPTENIHGSSAVFHYAGGSITLRDCEFIGNVTTRNNMGSGPEQVSRQVKVHSEFQQTTAVIERCVFSKQRSGGSLPIFQLELEGVYPQLSLLVSNCAFESGGAGTSSVIWTDSATTITDSVGCGFESVTAPWMTSEISISSCEFLPICTDCDRNGTADVVDIHTGHLQDSNADGIPDICQVPTCADADFFRDFNVNGADLGILLSQWGPANPNTVSDINHDGVVNGADLGIFLGFWGRCPN